MTAHDMPFSAGLYRLSACELKVLNEQDAEYIADMLAVMDPWCRMAYTASGLHRYLIRRDPALYRFMVVTSESIAGVVGVRHPWLRGPYLELLAIFPPFQGNAIGRNVINWLAEESRSHSGYLWTTVSSFNDRAHAFYRKNGFFDIVELPDLVHTGFTESLLQKKCQ